MKKSTARSKLGFISVILFLLVFIVFAVSSCKKDCNHEWKDATCTEPMTCTLCGETEGEPLGHTHKDALTAEPTCTENGFIMSVCNCGDIKNEVIPAKGHSWDKDAATCFEVRVCSVCLLSESKLTHNYVIESQTNANCVKNGTKTFSCTICNDKYTEIVELAKGHTASAEVVREDETGSNCTYIQILKCLVCQGELQGSEVNHHCYTASVSKEATCVSDGVKTFKCSGCNAEFNEPIEKNVNSHNWNKGTLSGNIRTCSCTNTGCNVTKKVVDATTKNQTIVKASDLASAGGVKLKNADIDFGSDALNTLKNKDLTISSDVLGENDIKEATKNLSNEKKALLGDNPTIYDFKATESGNAISNFGGEITVTIPYTLKDGEDVDKIAVWYMSGEAPELIKAEYSNGNITFKTTHFSLYTVAQVSDADRCALYGHTYDATEVAGDCLADSYKIEICRYCNVTVNTITKKATGHNYVETVEAATCTTDGKTTFKCLACYSEYSTKLNATGHNYSISWEWSDDCSTAVAVFACQNTNAHVKRINATVTETKTKGVDSDKFDYSAVVGFEGKDYSNVKSKNVEHEHAHSYGEWIELTQPTCINDGVKMRTCTLCGFKDTQSYTSPEDLHKFSTHEKMVREYGYCKGYVSVSICEVCGQSGGGVEYSSICCRRQDGQDAKGYNVVSCDKCKCYYKYKTVETVVDICHTISENEFYFYDQSGNLLFETQYTDKLNLHEFVLTSETLVSEDAGCSGGVDCVFTCARCGGTETNRVYYHSEAYSFALAPDSKTCADGVIKTTTCALCREVSTEIVYDHRFEHNEYNLNEYGTCGGYAYRPTCELCGETGLAWECDCVAYRNLSSDERLNGEYTCSKCKSTFVFETQRYSVDNHYFSTAKSLVVKSPKGETVLSLQSMCDTIEHTYEQTNIVYKNSKLKCVTGYVITYSCTGCDSSYTLEGGGHSYYEPEWVFSGGSDSCTEGVVSCRLCVTCGTPDPDYVPEAKTQHTITDDVCNLSDYGFCSGFGQVRACEHCKYVEFVAIDRDCCKKRVSTDADGTSVYTCTKCHMVKKQKTTTITDGCQKNSFIVIQYFRSDGTLLFETSYSRTTEKHSFEYSYTLDNPKLGCEGGVSMLSTCKACGYTESNYRDNLHGECELVKTLNEGSKMCEDGWTGRYVCSRCHMVPGNTDTIEGNTHEEICETRDLSEYGFCSGEVYVSTCRICNYSQIIDIYHDCCEESGFSSKVNISTQLYKCTKCKCSKRKIRTTTHEGCVATEKIVTSYYTSNGSILFESIYERSYESHSFEKKYTFKNPAIGCSGGGTLLSICSGCGYTTKESILAQHAGSYEYVFTLKEGALSCDEGWTASRYCTICNLKIDSSTIEGEGHYGSIKAVDLSEHDFCRGVVTIYNCLICNTTQQAFLHPDCCCTREVGYDADGYKVYVCDTCGCEKHILSTTKTDGNKTITTLSVKYKSSTEGIVCEYTANEDDIFINNRQ